MIWKGKIIVWSPIESQYDGIQLCSIKSFLSRIPDVFTSEDIVRWLREVYQVVTHDEAIHIGTSETLRLQFKFAIMALDNILLFRKRLPICAILSFWSNQCLCFSNTIQWLAEHYSIAQLSHPFLKDFYFVSQLHWCHAMAIFMRLKTMLARWKKAIP